MDCPSLPQDMYASGSAYMCTSDFHFCAACARQLHRPQRMPLRGGDAVDVYDLRGCVFAANGDLYSFTRNEVEVPFSAAPLKRLKLLMFDKGHLMYLWESGSAFSRIESIHFEFIEDREKHVKAAVMWDFEANKHVFETGPLRHNNRERISWWGVASRFYCKGAQHPSIRGPLSGRFLIWGVGERELGRVRLE